MNFFVFHFTGRNRPFLTPAIFYFDGWMGWDGMGWDGMGGRSTFFFLSYLGNYKILFFNVSDPLNIVLCTSFSIFLEKKL